MKRFYVAFDDTDTLDCGRGTGKLARWFTDELPSGFVTWGVVRQQLLYASDIPMTSHNSSLCCVIDAPDFTEHSFFIERATKHIAKHFFDGSDPGLCVACENDPDLEYLTRFGIKCTQEKVSQQEAIAVAKHVHLSGHGGTNDGIIGALAGVGLTIYGESGRMVSYKDIRELPQETSAKTLRDRAIFPVSSNRHAEYIPDSHIIDNQGSLRPHLCGGKLIIPVLSIENEKWQTIDQKKEYRLKE